MAIRKTTKTSARRNTTRAAIMVLHRRVEKLERWRNRLDGERRRIGFEPDVRGEIVDMDEDEIPIPGWVR